MVPWLAAVLMILPPTLLVRPWMRRIFVDSDCKMPLPITALSLLIGPVFFLLLFSLWGRIAGDYNSTFVLSMATLGAVSWTFGRKNIPKNVSNDLPFLAMFLLLFATSFVLRTYWPALHWDNSAQRLGVERMFNLSIQQSFLYSTTWPPNNLWLHGEPLHYHLLLRAGPGLAAWIARVWFNAPLSGGALYLIYDALYLCLAPLAVAVWGYIVMSGAQPAATVAQQCRRRNLALLSGVLVYLAPHGAALGAGVRALFTNGTVDFWLIQHEVVRGTVNFFPFGLLLSGEGHSYAQAPFLQICLWGSFVWMMMSRYSLARILLCSVCATGLVMAHPASALLAAIGLGTASSLLLVASDPPKRLVLIKVLITIGCIASALLLPELLTWRTPETRWVFVTRTLTSRLVEFLSAQAAVLACIALFIGPLICRRHVVTLLQQYRSWLFFLAVVVSVLFLIDRPAIACSVVLFSLLSLYVRQRAPRGGLVSGAICIGLATIWIVPELVVSDWVADNRTDWVRFNTVMRFWLDGYYLIPCAIVMFLGARVAESEQSYHWCRRGLIFVLVMQIGALYPLLRNRLERTPEKPSANGFAFMAAEHREDWWLIEYLSRLPGGVVIGEACGTGSSPHAPYHYGMPGRISAFSGRPSLCGWGRHTWLFQRSFTQGALRGTGVWHSFLSYEKALAVIYRAEAQGELLPAIQVLRDRGVTHLVFGELEQLLYGRQDLQNLAQRIQGQVLTEPIRGKGIIKLP